LYDVAVIGGGPVGSQVAYKLAEMGYRVVVMEQKKRLGEPVCCTGIISQECVSSFAIDESVIFRQATVPGFFRLREGCLAYGGKNLRLVL